jgi:peptidoglycan hydrolase CwlO-like protein
MTESSRLTNILLAIIAICLLVIAFRPASVVPTAGAQAAIDNAADRFSDITATNKSAMAQVDAIRAVATAIDGLAKSTGDIAKAMDNLSRSVTDVGGRVAEGQAGAAAAAAGAATPAPK